MIITEEETKNKGRKKSDSGHFHIRKSLFSMSFNLDEHTASFLLLPVHTGSIFEAEIILLRCSAEVPAWEPPEFS